MAKKKDIEPLIKDDNHIGNGTFGDVYVGNYKGQTVALKRINKGTKEEGDIILWRVNCTNYH